MLLQYGTYSGEDIKLAVLMPGLTAGLSLQWFIYKGFNAELGASYTHTFSNADNTGAEDFLHPSFGIGWRF
jgi:hypothetical protein